MHSCSDANTNDCANLGDGAVIGHDSCNSGGCLYAGNAGHIEIGNNSCNGDDACSIFRTTAPLGDSRLQAGDCERNLAGSVPAACTVVTYALTTAASPAAGGTVSGAGTYNSGAIVPVTQTPNTGYAFTSWTGACTGTGTCSVTVDAAKTVTANYGRTPANGDACKKNGWSTLVDANGRPFKNQGACVSYVEHLKEKADKDKNDKEKSDKEKGTGGLDS